MNAQLTKNGHKHAEAFCLMRYECSEDARPNRTGNTRGCGHHEIIWNSRDGVTPFLTGCPSCGGMMSHAYFGSDVFAPDHKPHRGQRFWRDGTLAEYEAVYLRRILEIGKESREEAEKHATEIARDEISRGAPWLDIAGYKAIEA